MLVKKVAVVGGGISGSVAAIALADRGVQVERVAAAHHRIRHSAVKAARHCVEPALPLVALLVICKS